MSVCLQVSTNRVGNDKPSMPLVLECELCQRGGKVRLKPQVHLRVYVVIFLLFWCLCHADRHNGFAFFRNSNPYRTEGNFTTNGYQSKLF